MSILPFKLADTNNKAVSALFQFFSLSNPSADDITFLLVARRSGRTAAKRLAFMLNWNCQAAIQAVDILSA
jgi:hypothetical protein